MKILVTGVGGQLGHDVMNELNGSEFMGRQLVIKEARPRD